MQKIVHVPLDERPCNYDFPKEMFQGSEFDIIRVPFEYMGLKKKPGNIEKIKSFLLKECQDAYALIVAIDTMVYGGIVPSRLHYFTLQEVLERLYLLKEIKRINPKIKIYAYNLVMRCPRYDDDDEEPFYYQYFGYAIHMKKALEHKIMANVATKEEIEEYNSYIIPDEYVNDYSSRREINTALTCEAVKLVYENIIDFLIVPQDDSAPFGYTALDQMKVRGITTKYHLEDKVLTYPGADEVSNTLFARMLNEYYHKKPLIYVKYPSDASKNVIPCAEDRPLDISVRYQIIAAGALLTTSLKEADLVLAINAPSSSMCSIGFEEYADYHSYVVGRNLLDFVEFIKYCLSINKPVTICDIGYANGADKALVSLIDSNDLYMSLAGYASWNIPCNSLGTAIPMGIKYIYPHDKKKFDDFLMHRFVEDILYCGLSRTILRKKYCNESTGFTIYDTKGQRNETFLSFTKKVLEENLNEFTPHLKNRFKILDMYFPWSRTYEIGLKVEAVEKNG